MKSTKEKNRNTFETLKTKFGYTNVMQAPKILKVVVSAGVGSFKDKKKIELVENRLAKITGQKAAKRGAKQSIAAFKVRQGDTVGFQVTLRGQRMYDFLDRLINIALPRTKDFRGVSVKSIDNIGNYTIGIKEHTIFPETSDEELKDVFGMAVTLVTNSKDKEQTKALLEHIGMPLKKNEDSLQKKSKKK